MRLIHSVLFRLWVMFSKVIMTVQLPTKFYAIYMHTHTHTFAHSLIRKTAGREHGYSKLLELTVVEVMSVSRSLPAVELFDSVLGQERGKKMTLISVQMANLTVFKTDTVEVTTSLLPPLNLLSLNKTPM